MLIANTNIFLKLCIFELTKTYNNANYKIYFYQHIFNFVSFIINMNIIKDIMYKINN